MTPAHDWFNQHVVGRTYGDLATAIYAIETDTAADLFFRGYIDDLRAKGIEDAELTARVNIGYLFGDGMTPERIEMWKRVTGARHPWGLK